MKKKQEKKQLEQHPSKKYQKPFHIEKTFDETISLMLQTPPLKKKA